MPYLKTIKTTYMKTKLTSLLAGCLLVLTCNQSFSQEYEYVPFPTSNAEWSNFDRDYHAPEGYVIMNSIYKLSDEDTILYGILCHKLYRMTDSLTGTGLLWGCIGEKDKKVYYFN